MPDLRSLSLHIKHPADQKSNLINYRQVIPLAELLRGGICPHLEIETYTWGVLPGGESNTDIVKGIAKEFQWVKENLLLQQAKSHIC